MVKTTMEDVGLRWNPKKCAVVHVRRGVHVTDNSGMILDETARMPILEDGKQYKFLGVLGSLTQEDKLVLECAVKEYLRQMSVIWTSPLSDRNRVTASNQFALPVLGYLMWTQQWPILRWLIRDTSIFSSQLNNLRWQLTNSRSQHNNLRSQLKEARGSFFGRGVEVLKLQSRIEDRLRSPS